MKSFKKIALVMIATLTMGTMTVLPASAAIATTLKVSNATVATGTVSTNPTLLPVPADNSVDAADALQIAITGLANNTVVSAVVTNGRIVPALATLTVPVTSASGSTSLSINTGTGDTADFFVYTTSTNDGTVSVTIGGNVTTYYFRGTVGALNAITLTAPATAVAGTTENVVLSGVDVFGNAKGGATVTLQVISTASTTTSYTTDSATTATTTLGSKTVAVAIPTSGTVTLVATATVAAQYLGLATPVAVVIKTITVRDVLSELTSVKAELALANAALAAEKTARAADKVASDKALADEKTARAADKVASDKALADLVTTQTLELAKVRAEYNALILGFKKAFNTLAKKWNAKNPRAKVALLS